MSTISGEGGTLVPPPRCEERPFGLMSVAEHDQRGDFKWAKGLEYDILPCGTVGVVSAQCPVLPEQTKTAQRGYNTEVEGLFTVYAGWECSPGSEDEQAWDNAEALLDAGWKEGVERAFWTGMDQDGNPIPQALATSGAVDLTPAAGALDLAEGLGTLESYMGATSHCRPTVHANIGIGPLFGSRGLILPGQGIDPRVLVTGSRLALGAGYPATGPDDEEPGVDEAWIFISGPVRVTSSPVFFAPGRGDKAGAVDRSNNDVRVFAERMFSIGRGCGLAAVKIVLSR